MGTYPTNGVDDFRQGHYAITGVDVQVNPKTLIEDATLVIKEGRVVSVKSGSNIPDGAVEVNMEEMMVYPAFIDIYSNYGTAEYKKSDQGWDDPQIFTSPKEGAYAWNDALMPEHHNYMGISGNKKEAEKYRKMGFGAVVSHRMDGIVRGTGATVLLSDESENQILVNSKTAAFFSFDPGEITSMSYPTSLMGSIALLRQTYYDGDWYQAGGDAAEYNISLEEFQKNRELPAVFEGDDLLNTFRIQKIGDEFGVDYIIKGDGTEYRRAEDIAVYGNRMIVPLSFPDAYSVKDPWDADLVTLEQMKHWELAPYNAGMLAEAGVPFAFTSDDDPDAFMDNLRKAVSAGLSEEDALAALTTIPADWMYLSNDLGSLENGQIANFIITDGNLFEEDTKIYQTWVNGNQYKYKDQPTATPTGKFMMEIGDEIAVDMLIKGDPGKEKMKIVIDDSTKIKVKYDRNADLISIQFDGTDLGMEGMFRLSGTVSMETATMGGSGQDPDGNWHDWAAYGIKASPEELEEETTEGTEDTEGDGEEVVMDTLGPVIYPFTAYGYEEAPEEDHVIIKNVTVWTNEEEGILENYSVYLRDGKINKIAENIFVEGAEIIDGTGKHFTAGVIDEHSHIAISYGVNESGQASSAEVSIASVVNSEDVNLYRQLAGGVVAAQLLHGSANPIGGQSGIIKFRWGKLPEEMKISDADGFIKFALGENVKQSNWGDNNTTRFPQTRMGVEQTFYNYFTKAKEYGELKEKAGQRGYDGAPLRKDLELETLLEILESERYITCHSYVQSEINMLMHVADSFGFTMGTFTHILEGYKVADKMKAHGVNASTFSDWWAYKYEVIDAIPYNAALLTKMGVNTAINSDDAEMGRRLNQEAAKGIKYGGMTEEEAWKMVTLNPAKMLHLDDQMGSVKVGKSADVVLWSDNPLSIYAVAEKTWVDGVRYYDRDKEDEMTAWIQNERNRLIQEMIDAENGGSSTQKAKRTMKYTYGCADLGLEASGEHHH